jgi:hypothetical protein
MTSIQGTIYRSIEGVAGENFTMSDVVTGSKKAYGDLKGLIDDTQKQFPTSKSNLLIRRFGLETQLEALTNKFVQQNAITRNLDESAMYSVTTMAETIVTSNLMYTMLGNIKTMNGDGKYINSEGKVVSKKDAMSLDEAYSVVDGKLKLNNNVVYTENNLHTPYTNSLEGEKTIAGTEISRYIRSVYADLYGQYNQDLNSMFEMTIIGKLVTSMRRWLPRGMHRRMRGITSGLGYTFEDARDPEQVDKNLERRFYSQDQKRFQEGYYTTGVRYLNSIYKKWKGAEMSLMAARKNVKGGMSFHEEANIKRLLGELSVITISMVATIATAMFAKSLDDDDDDRSQDKLYYMAYILERINTEALTFINPYEFAQIIQNPATSINTITKISRLIENLMMFDITGDGDIDWNINNKYDRGPRKGEYKVRKNMLNFVPWYKKSQQLWGIMGGDSKESMKDVYEYMNR